MMQTALSDIATLPGWMNHAHPSALFMLSLLHLAEQHKPLALYTGATIVVLNGLWAMSSARRRA